MRRGRSCVWIGLHASSRGALRERSRMEGPHLAAPLYRTLQPHLA
jgi:hypothetical protein